MALSHVIPSGHTLRRLREAAGLTQKALAEKAGLSQALISRIEKGTVDPRLSTLRKIIDAISSSGQEAAFVSDVMQSPVASVDESQTVREAVELMRRHDFSQLPVLRNDFPVGSIQESTLLKRLTRVRDVRAVFELPVREVMEEAFPMVPPSLTVEEAAYMLSRGTPALIVMDKSRMLGIVTKIDTILTALRGQQPSRQVSEEEASN